MKKLKPNAQITNTQPTNTQQLTYIQQLINIQKVNIPQTKIVSQPQEVIKSKGKKKKQS